MVRDKWLITDEYKKISIMLLVSNLTALRARLGITQEELANIVGLSRQTYSSIESGKKDITWSLYLALMFFFNSVSTTSEMLEDMRIYPIDLVARFNDTADPYDDSQT